MDAFQIVDALVASFFGLIGIWAAVVRRHWFLRFVVVSVFLLSTVLITAHEVAIEFGIQIALLMAGVWIARNLGNWQFKFSVETVLLLMVVVAIVSAVIGKAEHLSWWAWHFMISTGIYTAGYALSGLWLVFGKTRLRYRIPVALLSIAIGLGFYHFAEGTRHAISAQINNGDWLTRLAQHYEVANVIEWLSRNAPQVLLGAILICSALLTGRYSGWFSESSDDSAPRTKSLASIGLIAVLLTITSPLLYIFYRLMSPTQFPVVEIREPNGYDDIIAAGNMLADDGIKRAFKNRHNFTEQQYRNELDRLAPALERIKDGVNQPYFQIRRVENSWNLSREDRVACEKVAIALLIKIIYLDRFGKLEQQLDWALKTLPLEELLVDGWQTSWPESEGRWQIQKRLHELDSSTCLRLVKELEKHDRKRRALKEYLLPIRITNETNGWAKHLRSILREWSEDDPYKSDRQHYQRQVAVFRMLIVQLALQSYFLDQHRLPDQITELVPDYMSAIPTIPISDDPIKYQQFWGGYALSCDIENRTKPLIAAGPAAPYFWQRLQESWQEFKTWSQNFPAVQPAKAPR